MLDNLNCFVIGVRQNLKKQNPPLGVVLDALIEKQEIPVAIIHDRENEVYRMVKKSNKIDGQLRCVIITVKYSTEFEA